MKQKILLIVFIVSLLVLPQVVSAVSWWPLVPCGTSVNPEPCNQCDLFRLLKNIIDFVLIGLMPPAAAILFVWGGFLILMGGANPGMISQGKSIFWNTAIGVAIISASWMITNTIIRSIGVETITQDGVVTNVASEWWKFECRVTTGGPPPPVEKKYACQNSQCIENAGGTYTEPTCNNSCGTVPPPPTQKYSCNSNNQCVVDPNGQYATNNCDDKCVSVPANLVITTSSLSDARQDFDYSQAVQATGGNTPYNWSISDSSQLPPGLMINSSTGEISGKPTASGNFTFTVVAEDSSSPQKSATKQLSLKVVAPAASVVISNVRTGIIDSVSATIGWSTDKPSTSQVESGRTTSYDATTPVNNAMVLNHSVALINLTPNTTYNYRVISTIPGFTAHSSNYSFSTSGQPPPPPAQKYSCNSNNQCVINSAGQYTTSNCDNKCQTPPPPNLACMFNGVNYSTANLCSGQSRPGGCGTSMCSQYLPSIRKYAGGAATVDVLKTFMVVESDCNIKAHTGTSYGLMQITPDPDGQGVVTRAIASRCGVSQSDITSEWLTNPSNADKSICLGAAIINSIAAGTCGSEPRNIYAGYNAGPGNCTASRDCTGEQSCSSGVKRKWECPYDNAQHTVCNTGMYETKQGATYINYCLNHLGF